MLIMIWFDSKEHPQGWLCQWSPDVSWLHCLKSGDFGLLAPFQWHPCDLYFVSFLQGTGSSFVKPSCSQSSCRQKLRLCSDRDCFQPAERPYPTGAILQPNEEYVNMTQACCSPKLPFHLSQENLPVTQTLYSKIDSPPNQEHYTFNPLQSPCLTRYSKSPGRMLPLLAPHTRQSLESLCHTHPFPPISKGPKFWVQEAFVYCIGRV